MIEALFLLLAGAPQAAADPLAPARAGKVQCANPNVEKKTCMGLTSYKLNPDGSFETSTTLLIAPQPPITMDVKSSGKRVGDQLCAPIRKEDFEAATFKIDGTPLDAATATSIRGQILGSLAPMIGKMGCSRETPDGAVLKAEVTLDGVARPELTQRVLWVMPEDGFKLGL
ncbi:hypothetical protein FHS95_000235 [Sphingomonas naasensis]|uniref:Uncharacterized protein n=1 Tax=Sphingomonas naasensis TaxID=1344951 RepID=A0A4S1WW30_9SPHN|nr:hypothetical protein [Sphingomonas naasensis]NIJ18566.1 hypothetical protein [Sphingomonas naasensis]TGX45816.1 hypothetical protein E5A74_01140 [Sphingomonas naasensis]